MAWNHVFLKNKFILYGYGISNQKVAEFFIQNHINFKIVKDDIDLIEEYIIIKSPGIENDTLFLKKCYTKKLLIINDIELFYILRPEVKYIGITGTCGKTTTCTLLYNIMLKQYNVKLCGNIGIPIFTYINEDLDYLIVELSSYQLEWINNFRLDYFIILNVFDHHLNHHKNYNNYLNAKLKPIINLKETDTLIVNQTLVPHIDGRKVKAKVFTFSSLIIEEFDFDIRTISYFNYKFNQENFAGIYYLLKELKISNKIIYEELLNFNNLPHRMETIFNTNKLIIINDSKSTGFNSLNEGIKYCINNYSNYKLVIIIGGKIDLEEIRKNIGLIKSLNKYKVFCYGENSKILCRLVKCDKYKTLQELIDKMNIIEKQIILFSPAAQSLDQFNSFEERGNVFKKLIFKKLNL